MRFVVASNALVVVAAGGVLLVARRDEGSAEWTVARCAEADCHSAPITCLAVSPCGLWAVTGAEDRFVRVWSLADLRVVSFREARALTALTCVRLRLPGPDPAPQLVVIMGDRSGNITVATLPDVNVGMRVIAGHTGAAISALAIAERDHTMPVLLSADGEEKVRATRLPYGHEVEAYLLGHGGPVQQTLVLHHVTNAGRVFTVGGDGVARLFRGATEPDAWRPVAAAVLPCAPRAAVEFVGGPLSILDDVHVIAPTRAEVLAAVEAAGGDWAAARVLVRAAPRSREAARDKVPHTAEGDAAGDGIDDDDGNDDDGDHDAAGAGRRRQVAARRRQEHGAADDDDDDDPPVDDDKDQDDEAPQAAGLSTDFTVTAVADDNVVRTEQPLVALRVLGGLLDIGWVCSGAAECPSTGVVVVCITTTSSSSAAVAAVAESSSALMSGMLLLLAPVGGTLRLIGAERIAPARFSDLGFLPDPSMLVASTSDGRLVALRVELPTSEGVPSGSCIVDASHPAVDAINSALDLCEAAWPAASAAARAWQADKAERELLEAGARAWRYATGADVGDASGRAAKRAKFA